MQRLNNPSLPIGEAVRAWCAVHPLPEPGRERRCPMCRHRECFDRLPASKGPERWTCFSANHGGAGLRGNGCSHGDALDLEAHHRGLSRVEVLRADGYLDGRTTRNPSRPPPVSAPKRPADPLAPWASLAVSGDVADLVRLDADGEPLVRAYALDGRPIGVRHLETLPTGWYGTTPRGAVEVLRARKPGRWATPSAYLAGDVSSGPDLVLARDLTPAVASHAPATFADTLARVVAAFGGTVETFEEVPRG